MELIEAFDRAMAEFDQRVHQVGDQQWESATPCTEWTVRDLVNHLTNEQLWAPFLLRGATLGEVGDRFDGDVLGDAPVRAWEEAAGKSRSAFHRPGAVDGEVHTSAGLTPAEDYGWHAASARTTGWTRSWSPPFTNMSNLRRRTGRASAFSTPR